MKNEFKAIIKSLLFVPWRLTGKLRVLPDFAIIGAQKAGTTSLHNYLTQHPQIASLASPLYTKEIHYFDINYSKGLDWYRAFFPTSAYMARIERELGTKVITGEACPYYLFHPHAPLRFKETLPHSKAIVLLRNPVDRAYSHYQHEVRKGWEKLPFEEALDREVERLAGEVEQLIHNPNYYSQAHRSFSYLGRGRYIEQLRPWIENLGLERVLVLSAEELYEYPEVVLAKVFEYLGVAPFQGVEVKKHNAFRYKALDHSLRERLVTYFEPYNLELYDYLGIDFGWERGYILKAE